MIYLCEVIETTGLQVNREIASEILNLLRNRRCMPTANLVEELNASWSEVVGTLIMLEQQGVIFRAEQLDPTKPIASTRWCLNENLVSTVQVTQAPAGVTIPPQEPLGYVVGYVVTPPIIVDLGLQKGGGISLPGLMGLLDFLKIFLCGANDSIKIMMPYIGPLLTITFQQCAEKISSLKSIKILTEETRDNHRELDPLQTHLNNLEVRYATQRSKHKVKVRGVHAKLIIVDDSVALVGTFNLTETHVTTNYDVGVVIKGPIVRYLSSLFDNLWGRTRGEK